MRFVPHYGNCKEEIAELKKQLDDARKQVVDYMNELTEVTCRLRIATLKCDKQQCLDSPSENKVE